jgi:hypothetical protein
LPNAASKPAHRVERSRRQYPQLALINDADTSAVMQACIGMALGSGASLRNTLSTPKRADLSIKVLKE